RQHGPFVVRPGGRFKSRSPRFAERRDYVVPATSTPGEATAMASIRKEIVTSAQPDAAWDAIRDVGALHTRLVPGFVIDTRLEPGSRVVTFGNGMVVREPIVDIDDRERRLVWGAIGGPLTHYNGAVQVFP